MKFEFSDMIEGDVVVMNKEFPEATRNLIRYAERQHSEATTVLLKISQIAHAGNNEELGEIQSMFSYRRDVAKSFLERCEAEKIASCQKRPITKKRAIEYVDSLLEGNCPNV